MTVLDGASDLFPKTYNYQDEATKAMVEHTLMGIH
jgi:hypothetical protein